QEFNISKSIFFDSKEYLLSSENKEHVERLITGLEDKHLKELTIQGHTDHIGQKEDNFILSEKRAKSVYTFLLAKGVESSLINIIPNGEESPIANNDTPEGRAKNRRVDINIKYENKIVVIQQEPIPAPALSSIQELYQLLEKPYSQFQINPAKDTVLTCKEGTIVVIPANSFELNNNCASREILFEVKEVYQFSDMLTENLSTLSNNRLLETHGMLKTSAKDCDGNDLKLKKDHPITIFVPAASQPENLAIFSGKRDSTNQINWNEQKEIAPFFTSKKDIANSLRPMSDPLFRCPFFFCRIKNFFGFWNIRSYNYKTQTQQELAALKNKYGVKDLKKLAVAMNIDMEDLSAENIIAKSKMEKISKGGASTNDIDYIVFRNSKLEWKNCDVFSNIKQSKLATIKINIPPAANTDCKIIFKKQKALISGTRHENKFAFRNIPKDETAWIVAFKYEDNSAFISAQEINTSKKIIQPKAFKKVTLEELKSQLKRMDI
ncbi:MAG: OmpA family protein, partial [Bacteroidota bacterium]